MKTLTHYEVLELDEGANEAAIREQVMKLRKFWHSGAAIKHKQRHSDLINHNTRVKDRIDKAAKVLSDESQKKIYDKNLPTHLSEEDKLFRVSKEFLLKEYSKGMKEHLDLLRATFSRCRRAINSSLLASQEERLSMLQLIKHIDDQLEILNPKEIGQLLLNTIKDLKRQCLQDSGMIALFCKSFNSFCINSNKFNPKEIPLRIFVLAFITSIYHNHAIYHFLSCADSMTSPETIFEKINSFFMKLLIENELKNLKSKFSELSEIELLMKIHHELKGDTENHHNKKMDVFMSEDAAREAILKIFSIRNLNDSEIIYCLDNFQLERYIVNLQIVDLMYEKNDVVFKFFETKYDDPLKFIEYIKSTYYRCFPLLDVEIPDTDNKFVDLLITLVICIERDTYDPKLWPIECHTAFDKHARHVYQCATDESLSCFWRDQRTYHRGHDMKAQGQQLAEADPRPKREGNPDVVLMTEKAYNCHVALCVNRQEQRCWLLHVSPPAFLEPSVDFLSASGRGKHYLDLNLPYFDGDTMRIDRDQLEIYVFSNQAGQAFIPHNKLQSLSSAITYHEVGFDIFDVSYVPRSGEVIIRSSRTHDNMRYYNIDIAVKNIDTPASDVCCPRK